MGGFDHKYQLRGYYHVHLRCRKYYEYIFWFLFDVAVISSYILTKHYTDLSIKDVKAFCKNSGRPILNPAKQFCAAHFPMRGSEKVDRSHFCHTYKHQRYELYGIVNTVIGFCATMAERMTASFITHTTSHPLLFHSFRLVYVYNTTYYYQYILRQPFTSHPE